MLIILIERRLQWILEERVNVNNISKGVHMKQKVYNFLKIIPKGKVATYAQIAEYLGNKNLCRVVGNILHNNPDPIKYPCYKVVNSKGELSKNFGDGGIEIQKQRLVADGIEVIDYKVDLKRYKMN
ncbi:MAG: MGMT family protein [Clostridia bacterium]